MVSATQPPFACDLPRNGDTARFPLSISSGEAFSWLCRRRKDAGPNHDVWRLRERWDKLRGGLLNALDTGRFRFQPVQMANGRDGKRYECWEAEDAVVLKMVSLTLESILSKRLSKRCYHLPGHGGCKGAVTAVREALHAGRYPFVLRSDARGYYSNISHPRLLEQVRCHVDDPVLLGLVSQYCHRTTVHRGLYKRIEKGIPLGCSLSPLMAALYLDPLDRALENLPGVRYVRFMDDWVVLAESRWKLRRAVNVMNGVLSQLGLEQHPDKTFIGRVERGFDFLGFDFSPAGVTGSSERSEARFTENISRLYERGATKKCVERYRQNWSRWRRGILVQCDHPRLTATLATVPCHSVPPHHIPRSTLPADHSSKLKTNDYESDEEYIHNDTRSSYCAVSDRHRG